MVLSFVASLAGVLSYRSQQYRTITTARGEVVEVADAGVYRYSLRTLVTSGAPWDLVWLGLAIPVLAVAFGLHLRGSVRGTLLFVGMLASSLYKYLLWSFDWAYNPLYLIYVALFSLIRGLGLPVNYARGDAQCVARRERSSDAPRCSARSVYRTTSRTSAPLARDV